MPASKLEAQVQVLGNFNKEASAGVEACAHSASGLGIWPLQLFCLIHNLHAAHHSMLQTMPWTDPQGLLSVLMGPSPFAIIITLIVAFGAPILLHLWIYRSSSPSSLPTFLLVGPSGAGKTTLLTLVSSLQRTSHTFDWLIQV